MLTIICGEDTIASRAYLQEAIQKYKEKEYDVYRIAADQIGEIPQENAESLSLFGLKKAYIVENLNKLLKRGKSEKLLKTLETLKDVQLIDWEDGISKRELKLQGYGTVKEFKLPRNIFYLIESCYPSNLKPFLELFRTMVDNQNEMFLYIMLVRQIRNLILVQPGFPPSSLQSWQVAKLKKQVSFWNKENLIDFYDKLIGLETGLKTGTNPYSLKESVEMLSCYFLK